MRPNVSVVGESNPYSLHIRVAQHPRHPSYIFGLSGKMTEAPVAADAIAEMLYIRPQAREVVVFDVANPAPPIAQYPYR